MYTFTSMSPLLLFVNTSIVTRVNVSSPVALADERSVIPSYRKDSTAIGSENSNVRRPMSMSKSKCNNSGMKMS